MSAANLIIRDPLAADAAAWRALWEGYCAFYRATVPAEVTMTTWQRIIDPQSPVFCRLAEREGKLVGFAVCVLHPATWTVAPTCYLEDLFVDPAGRGGGIGRAMINDLLRLAGERGWARLYWHTESDNLTARRLYDSFAPADNFVRYRLFLPR